MTNRKRWTRARRARFAETMAAKKAAGLPKALPPIIVQYQGGKLRTLKLVDIQVYWPVDDDG